VVLIKQVIQPTLPRIINRLLFPIFAAILLVLAALGGLKDAIDLVRSFFSKLAQIPSAKINHYRPAEDSSGEDLTKFGVLSGEIDIAHLSSSEKWVHYTRPFKRTPNLTLKVIEGGAYYETTEEGPEGFKFSFRRYMYSGGKITIKWIAEGEFEK
jgi:hypothetical protein